MTDPLPMGGVSQVGRFALYEVAETTSTMDAVKALPGPAVALRADRQSAGRGRRGRSWLTAGPSLALSARLPAAGPPPAGVESLFLAAILALFDVAVPCLPQDLRGTLSIKWPNDLLLDGRKLAGVLIEADGQGAACTYIIGWGLNLGMAPPGAAALPQGLAPAALARSLLIRLDALLDQAAAPSGLAALRARWRDALAGIGGPIRVRTPVESLEGLFTDVDAQGRLILSLPQGSTRVFAVGDVFLPPSDGAS